MTTHRFDAILALGSNMGDKIGHLGAACAHFEAMSEIDLLARSNLYRTEPWGEADQDWFVNACVGIATRLSPRALLEACQKIETDLGRVRNKRWGPRVIDIDVLIFNGITQDDPVLTLPHPLITERAFVLVPLNDIAPDLVLKGKPVSQWIKTTESAEVIKLDAFEPSASVSKT